MRSFDSAKYAFYHLRRRFGCLYRFNVYCGCSPGLLLGLSFIILIAIIGMKEKWPTHKRARVSDVFVSCGKVIPALLVPTIIIVGILSGVFAPTESAAFACLCRSDCRVFLL